MTEPHFRDGRRETLPRFEPAHAAVAKGPNALGEMNAEAVLGVLLRERLATISDIVTLTDLSRPAVSRAIRRLEQVGLVRESPSAVDSLTKMGRPAQNFEFAADAGYVIGVEFDPPRLRAVRADLRGEVTAQIEHRMTLIPSADEVYDAIENAVIELSSGHARPHTSYRSVVVGLAGIVDDEGGVDLKLVLPELDLFPLKKTLERRLGCEVVVENNVKLAVVAESWRGAATKHRSVVYIHWGKRVGTGIIMEGQLVRGAHRAAGELGYLDLFGEESPFVSESTPYPHFEDAVGVEVVVDVLRKAAVELEDSEGTRLLAAEDSEDALLALFDGNTPTRESALSAMDAILRRFGRGVRVIQLLFDPECIVIGGAMSKVGMAIDQAVQQRVEPTVFYPMKVELSALGADAIVLGGVHVGLEALGYSPRPAGTLNLA